MKRPSAFETTFWAITRTSPLRGVTSAVLRPDVSNSARSSPGWTAGKHTVKLARDRIETLVNVLEVLSMGGLEYAKLGTPDSTGTRLFCLSGCVQGIAMSDLLDEGSVRVLRAPWERVSAL